MVRATVGGPVNPPSVFIPMGGWSPFHGRLNACSNVPVPPLHSGQIAFALGSVPPGFFAAEPAALSLSLCLTVFSNATGETAVW